MISFRQKGDFKKLSGYLEKAKEVFNIGILDRYGEEGVRALAEATPKDTGLTAASWRYRIVRGEGSVTISFDNTNFQNGVPIAIILQYGHATRNGGYVQGIDYINPALRPVFEKIADAAWEEVKRV
ncbi:MAG: HK97 gp10 family phage protein [Ruminococcaceae bacterium]|nr:HK97 gp10 family phage protein [Oscillospiraceae bacterium]